MANGIVSRQDFISEYKIRNPKYQGVSDQILLEALFIKTPSLKDRLSPPLIATDLSQGELNERITAATESQPVLSETGFGKRFYENFKREITLGYVESDLPPSKTTGDIVADVTGSLAGLMIPLVIPVGGTQVAVGRLALKFPRLLKFLQLGIKAEKGVKTAKKAKIAEAITKTAIGNVVGFNIHGQAYKHPEATTLPDRLRETLPTTLTALAFSGAGALGYAGKAGKIISYPAIGTIGYEMTPDDEDDPLNSERKIVNALALMLLHRTVGDKTKEIKKFVDEIYPDAKPEVKADIVKTAGEQLKLFKETEPVIKPTEKMAFEEPTKQLKRKELPPPPKSKEYAKVDAMEKLNTLLKEAKPVRRKIEALYTKERGKRIAEIDRFIREQIDNVGGEEGYHAILSKLKGELIKPETRAKMVFEPFRNKITDAELKDIYLKTWKHPYLSSWEKVSAVDGLTRLFSGEIPRPKQLVLLEEVYGTAFIKNILSKRLWGAKAKDIFVEGMNTFRTLMTTADMSAFLRQGIIPIVAHPIISAKAIATTFTKFAFSPQSFKQYFKDLPKDPMYPLMRKSKLQITDPFKAGLTGREEPFMSRFAQKVPILGIPIRFAERSYVGYLNKVRVDLFKSWAEELTSQGMNPVKDINVFRAAADVIGTFTGRGSIGKLDRIGPELNIIFFSPRLISARFNALNPLWYAKQPKAIRKKAIGDFAKFVAVGTSTLALIKMYADSNPDLDITVETDPRSSDFGKIKLGKTRWDIWGGFQQWARVFTQFITGERKHTTTGEIVSLTKDEYPFTTRKEILLKFIEGKLAPVPALMNELIAGGKTFTGEDLTLKDVSKEKLLPMYIQDIADAYAEGGMGRAIGAGVPAFLGVGVQTYGPDEIKRQQLIESAEKRKQNKELDAILEKDYENQKVRIKDVKKFIESVKDLDNRKRLFRRFINYERIKDIPDKEWWLDLAELPPKFRAQRFWEKFKEADRKQRITMMKTARKVPGFASKMFNLHLNLLTKNKAK